MKINLLSDRFKKKISLGKIIVLLILIVIMSILIARLLVAKNDIPKRVIHSSSINTTAANDDGILFANQEIKNVKIVGIIKWKGKYSALIKSSENIVKEVYMGEMIGHEKYKIKSISMSDILLLKKNKQFHLYFDKSSEAIRVNNQVNQFISVHLVQAPVQIVIKSLARKINKNLVLSPNIQGEITLQLDNVPIQDALNVLLNSQHFSAEKLGHILYIIPTDESTQGESLHSELMKLNYAKATDVVKLLNNKKEYEISADERTNSIFIRSNQKSLQELMTLIHKLDKPIDQVLIEARIVNIDDDYEKELGVKFGITSGHHLSGSLSGANEIAGGKNPVDVKPDDRLNVDLPVSASNAGKIGLALFKLSKGTLLDLELSALESEGRAEIISTPRLLTANQQSATIEAGEEIPYQESVAQGVTSTSFKKAVLRLKVVPQVTPDRKIILHLEVNQDKRGSKEIKGVPAIDTRHVSTQVLVNDGQTVVLGGIYEHTKTRGVDRIPFFADLPLLGVLFRHTHEINNRRELLIFVRPEIVRQTEIK